MNTPRLLPTLLLLTALAACTATVPVADTHGEIAAAKDKLLFVDLQAFDSELAQSLSVPLTRVEVGFHDRVVPSALPERLQKWMAAVEAGGGRVQVQPAAPRFAARSPMVFIGAVSSLWSASKTLQEMGAQAQFRAAHGYDAEIVLAADDGGQIVVRRVVFARRG